MAASRPAGPHPLVDHLFRHEAGKMVAVLTRIFGVHNLQMAEDVVQEAFLKASQSWGYHAIPENPSAWLMLVAKNKALDILRRKTHYDRLSATLQSRFRDQPLTTLEHFFLDSEIADSQLRMIFACCHPALKQEDQVALTLKTASGFGIAEIAKALLTSEAVIEKRLYRAREFIRSNQISFTIPSGNQLRQRLETVYRVLYLIFNEGYNSLKSDELIRKDVCAEAMRLCILLCEHQVVGEPAGFALLSLMCFHASRFDSRIDENKDIVLLQHQDRSKWDRALMERGYYYMNLSSKGKYLSAYHIEAAIGAEYCLAADFENTNWERLSELYDLLAQKKPSPVVWLNRAVIRAQRGLVYQAIGEILAIDHIEKLLATQYIYNAVLGDLYMKGEDREKALHYLGKARDLTPSQAEKKLIGDKMNSLL